MPWGHFSALHDCRGHGRDGGPASHSLPLGVWQTSGCLVDSVPAWAGCLVPKRESVPRNMAQLSTRQGVALCRALEFSAVTEGDMLSQ